jgi:4-amino-4-deoxy-L-arabinose transferase-like glycosyltransferase
VTDTRQQKGRVAHLAVLALLVLVAAFRIRVADVPLERDEGEYAYAGQLALQGVPPYTHVYNMKFPGTYYAYSAIMALGGQSTRAIHLGLMVVNCATILLVFALGRRLLDDLTAAVAAAIFALLTLDRGVLGIWGHATHFALLFALGGIALLVCARHPARVGTLLCAGFLLGTAVLMKQHAAAYFAGGLALVFHECLGRGRRDYWAAVRAAGWLGSGFALPLLVVAAALVGQGVFGKFWFWTITYGREYVNAVPARDVIPNLLYGLGRVTEKTHLVWGLAATGLVALVISNWPAKTRAVVIGLTAISFLAVCPGFYFREHYFILLLPAIALLAAIALEGAGRLLLRAKAGPRAARTVSLFLFLVCAGQYTLSERHYLFSMSTDDIIRQRYKANIFLEAVEIANYIRGHSASTDVIAILGSEPEIFFYSGRRSATGHIYVYALMEAQPHAHRMQEEMIREIESAQPLYLVSVRTYASWLYRPGSDRALFDWARRYTLDRYDQVGIVVADGTGLSRVLWKEPAEESEPRSQTLARIYRRKGEAIR